MSPDTEPLLIGDGAAAGPGDVGEAVGGLVVGVGDGAVSEGGETLWSHGEGAPAPPVKTTPDTAEENNRRTNNAKRQM